MLLASSEKSEAKLNLVDGYYGAENLFCKYIYENDDDSKIIYIDVKINRMFFRDISFYISAQFSDNSIQYREVNKPDFSAGVTKGRVVTLYYFSKQKFTNTPFKLGIIAKLPGISISLIVTISLVIAACIICSVSIYLFSRRIRARNQARMNIAMHQANIHGNAYANIYPNANAQAGVAMVLPQQSEEEMKKKKKIQLDEMFNTAMKQQSYNQELGKFNLNCTICLEEYDKMSRVTLTVCNHLFHYDCLKSWLMKNLLNSKCPNCNYHLLPELADTNVYPNNNFIAQNAQVSHMNNMQNLN